MTLFVRVLETADEQKEAALKSAVASFRAGLSSWPTFQVDEVSFSRVPGAAFVYWVTEEVRQRFSDLPPFETDARFAKQGLATADDFRFVRMWWEVHPASVGPEWKRFLKGGGFSPFYSDVDLLVKWNDNGRELVAFSRSAIRNPDLYLQPGITWSSRPHRRGSFALVPEGCIFSVSGMMVLAPLGDLPALAAVLNSTAYLSLLHLLMPRGTGSDDQTLKYEIGYISSVPIPAFSEEAWEKLSAGAMAGVSVVRGLCRRNAGSVEFVLPHLVAEQGDSLADRLAATETSRAVAAQALTALTCDLDEVALAGYGIRQSDAVLLAREFSLPGAPTAADLPYSTEETAKDLVEALCDWALGVALGRFDIRLAKNGCESLPDPDPFDPLPVCSPGILQGDDGLPARDAPVGYPLELPPHGILVDDPGHAWDVIARIEAVFNAIAGDRAHAWIQEAEGILGRDLRDWLRRDGFERHLKRYSRSRRKAPLFWHLAPRSREYGIWLHSPVATRDTFYRIQNDYVQPKLNAAERRLLELRQHAGASPTGQQRKDLTAQESLVDELRAFREQVARIAPLWKPFRDDGVILNCAVLSPLFDHHRAWQKECARKWRELKDAKYDWSGWAMHLWPERVVAACASDRSIAIAHGLEEALWDQDDDGKWKRRADVEEQIAMLAAERRSSAVQSALMAFNAGLP